MGKGARPADVEALIREIHRYLAILEALRASKPDPPGDESTRRRR